MKKVGYIKMVLLGIICAMVGGTLLNRFLPSWEGLVKDVGQEGAWIISGIYHLIYGVFIGVGIILSILVSKKLNKQMGILTVILASLFSIALFDTGLTILGANIVGFFVLMILLVSISFFLNITLAYIIRHKKKEEGAIANSL